MPSCTTCWTCHSLLEWHSLFARVLAQSFELYDYERHRTLVVDKNASSETTEHSRYSIWERKIRLSYNLSIFLYFISADKEHRESLARGRLHQMYWIDKRNKVRARSFFI